MLKQHFSIDITAPVQKVRYILTTLKTYKQRTAPFNPAGSRFEGDRSQGSKILFKGPHPDNPQKIGGMIAQVVENRRFEYISLHHIAEIVDGVEQSPENSSRAEAYENYTFTYQNGITTLQIDIDVVEEFSDYMGQARPKALDILKNLSEQKGALITVSTSVYSSLDAVRQRWTTPVDVMQRNHASDDRHTPHAENDLRVGGRFTYTMAARDGSFSFNFSGTYTNIVPQKVIESVLDDGRTLVVTFTDSMCGTITVSEVFEAENENPLELQQQGWQAILDNFKKHCESV